MRMLSIILRRMEAKARRKAMKNTADCTLFSTNSKHKMYMDTLHLKAPI